MCQSEEALPLNTTAVTIILTVTPCSVHFSYLFSSFAFVSPLMSILSSELYSCVAPLARLPHHSFACSLCSLGCCHWSLRCRHYSLAIAPHHSLACSSPLCSLARPPVLRYFARSLACSSPFRSLAFRSLACSSPFRSLAQTALSSRFRFFA